MRRFIRVRICRREWIVELNQTGTASRVYRSCPLEGEAEVWGEEVYFSVPVEHDPKDPLSHYVCRGEVGFWPPGRAICLFFGATPESPEGTIRPDGPVIVIGRVVSDFADYHKVREGERARVERKEG